MASKIGTLTVDLRLVSQKFSAGLKKANAGLTGFRNSAQKATRSLGGMKAGLAGVLGAAGIGAMVNQSLKSADALGKMSDRLNISTESLAAFQQLVELNGSSSEQFEKGLQRMARSIGEAEQGFGTGKRALDTLGISIESLSGLSADEQFLRISEAISKVESASMQASISSDLFGRAGVELLNTIRQGRDGFESARKEVDKYGLALSRVEVAKIEAANDAILRAQKAAKGLSMQATQELAPILEVVANRLTEAAASGTFFKDSFRGVVEYSIKGAAIMSNGITGIKASFFAVKAALSGLGLAFSNAFDFIMNRVIIPYANTAANLLLAPLKTSLGFLAEYSDTAAEMFNKINNFEFSENTFFKNSADLFRSEMQGALDDIYEQGNNIIPMEAITKKLDAVFADAEQRAKDTVERIQQNASITYDNEPSTSSAATDMMEEETKAKESQYDFLFGKEKTFQEKMLQVKTGASKKAAAIQKVFALKEAITSGFAAIQKAWMSAPFPFNVPIVALTGAAVAGNISAIRGQAHDGLDYVPREGTWLLDKGERVVDSRTNADLKGFLNRGGEQMQSATMNATFNVTGNMDELTMKALERNQKKFIRMVQAAQGVPA